MAGGQNRCSAVELGWQNFKNIEDSRCSNKTFGFENIGAKPRTLNIITKSKI